MFRASKLSKSFISFFISLALIAAQVGFSADLVFGASGGSVVRPTGDTILAFTSDVHNCPGDTSAKRLGSWIDMIKFKYGAIDAMGFCGDMANGVADNAAEYWTLTGVVMNTVKYKGIEAIYTTGNHEFKPGDAQYNNGVLTSETNQAVVDKFRICTEGKEGDNYRIFCLGSASRTPEYRQEEIERLEAYLMEEVGKEKPTVVMTHFPLHYFINKKNQDRTAANVGPVIDVLNEAATNNTPDDPSDDRKIIFLWGHNHTHEDPKYDQIFVPGDEIQYAEDDSKEISFYYCAAGCMSDSEYGGADSSAYVKGKGLVLQIRTDDSLGFAYYNTEGRDVTESGNYPKILVYEKESSDPEEQKNEPAGPERKGSDGGTALGPGASAATAEKAILSMTSDDDPQGTVFGKLALKSLKQTNTSIDLRWNRVANASSYVIYGNNCGKGVRPVKIAVTAGNKQTIKTISNRKLIKGKYYKFIVVALDRNNNVVSISKVICVATKGGKVGNHKKVTVKKSVTKKAKKLKKGKTLKLKAKAVPQSKKLKVRKHAAVRYESTNTNIATVSKKGVVKAKNKGVCYVYAYAQNGACKKIKVTVK